MMVHSMLHNDGNFFNESAAMMQKINGLRWLLITIIIRESEHGGTTRLKLLSLTDFLN